MLLSSSAEAQRRYKPMQEFGLVFGTSYYLGDINPEKHFGTQLKMGGGAMYRINFDTRWSMKASLVFASIEAYDSDSDDPWQLNRNLSFRNDVVEGALTAELNFFDYELGNNRLNPVTPYYFMGLAYYKMKPMGQYNGVWYELQPLGTEGQGTTEGGELYTVTGLSVPFGLGVKANVFKIIGVSLEWGMRKTWTDYFDDVSGTYVDPDVLEDENGRVAMLLADRSLDTFGPDDSNIGMQRGDPGRKDWYSFATVTLSIRLTKPQGTCWENSHFR